MKNFTDMANDISKEVTQLRNENVVLEADRDRYKRAYYELSAILAGLSVEACDE